MLDIQSYLPMIKSIAVRYSNSHETREELVQEGLLKLHKIGQRYKLEDFSTDAWRRRLSVYIKNAILDSVRKTVRYTSRKSDLPDSNSFINIKDEKDQFERIAIQSAFKELSRLLPDVECYILSELLNPSVEYSWFCRQRDVIFRIACKNTHSLTRSDPLIDYTLAEYLGVNKHRFRVAVKRIKKTAIKSGLFL